MDVSSPTYQRVPCSPNLVEPVKNSSPVPSVPDVGSPLVSAGRGKCEVSYSYSPLLRHLLSEPVGKRLRSSPPVCSSCKKIKLASSSGKEQVVPTDSPTDSTTTKNLAQSPDYVKQFELFSGNDIFATREE